MLQDVDREYIAFPAFSALFQFVTYNTGAHQKSLFVLFVLSENSNAIRAQTSGWKDSVATNQLKIRRYLGWHNVDVWLGTPPSVFPSEENLIVLKEIPRDGKPLD